MKYNNKETEIMEEINLNEMTTLSEELNVAIGDVNRLRKAQMDFCLKHLVGKCFYASDGSREEEYFYFLDAFHESQNRVFLHVVRVYNVQDENLSYHHIEDVHKSFRVIADRLKEKLYVETTYNSFKDAYDEAYKQISEDVREFRLANPTTPKDEDGQSEEGE